MAPCWGHRVSRKAPAAPDQTGSSCRNGAGTSASGGYWAAGRFLARLNENPTGKKRYAFRDIVLFLQWSIIIIIMVMCKNTDHL